MSHKSEYSFSPLLIEQEESKSRKSSTKKSNKNKNTVKVKLIGEDTPCFSKQIIEHIFVK